MLGMKTCDARTCDARDDDFVCVTGELFHSFVNEINVFEKPEWTLIPNLNKDSKNYYLSRIPFLL